MQMKANSDFILNATFGTIVQNPNYTKAAVKAVTSFKVQRVWCNLIKFMIDSVKYLNTFYIKVIYQIPYSQDYNFW